MPPTHSYQAQMAIFWRIMHMITSRYGNYPMGQTLVALTMVFLNEADMPPTLTDLCEATGLPKASVSRYVSWQIREGFCEEKVDPADRRRRLLVQTEAGKAEWDWQITELNKIFGDIKRLDELIASSDDGSNVQNAVQGLEMMKRFTANAPERMDRANIVPKKARS